MKKYKIYFKKAGKRMTNSRNVQAFTPEEAYKLWGQYWMQEGDTFISMWVWDDVKGLQKTNWFPDPAAPIVIPKEPEGAPTKVSYQAWEL
jgi:hypothetical protein